MRRLIKGKAKNKPLLRYLACESGMSVAQKTAKQCPFSVY